MDAKEAAGLRAAEFVQDRMGPRYRIKGGGGALLREELVAAASHHLIIVVDRSKQVPSLGAFPLPEIIQA